VAPFNTNQGSQISNRTEPVIAWRWNLSPNKSNELRIGIQSAPVSFFPDLKLSVYPQVSTALGTVHVNPTMNLMSQPFLPFVTQGRNTSLAQLIETFGWTRGKHSMKFGSTVTYVRGRFTSSDSPVGSVSLGLDSSDPALPIFTSGNLPGSSSTDRGNAQDLYGMLAGRITDFGATVYVSEKTRQFVPNVSLVERVYQREFGFYGTDSWRLRPTLTVNYGLRWEFQGVPYNVNNIYFRLQNGFNDVFGVSGPGNLFKPGTLTGPTTLNYVLNGNRPWYDNDLNNFAPSLGFAWTPSIDKPLWNKLFGGPGKTVFRAGYAVNFTREGQNFFLVVPEGNGGFSGSLFSTPVDPTGTIGPGTFGAGTVTLASGSIPNVDQDPPAFVNSFPVDPTASPHMDAFQPDLKVPVVQSWSIGIQREITSNMVFEIRYVGNHGTGLWRRENFNEVNIFENGFLNEFLAAQSNLAICRANSAACIAAQAGAGVLSANRTANNYANWGLTGQVPLPIMTGAFTGSTNAAAGGSTQRNSNFRSGARVTNLDNGAAGGFANVLATSLTFWGRIQAAGFPRNFWRVNPDATGGTFALFNGAQSTYHGLQVEFRRRAAKGLQFNGNYTWSKSLNNYYRDSSIGGPFNPSTTDAFDTFRNLGRNKNPSPWDLRHQVKLQLIW
jgi:hypothetical protein